MVTSPLRSLIPGQASAAADLQALAQVVKAQLAAHQAGLPLVASQLAIPMQYKVWGLQFGRQESQVLRSPGKVADLFQRDGIDGRLLIVGEAGVGKTHTLLTVGELLLKRSGPVPVLLDVSAWAGETMREWLIATLWQEYRVGKGAASNWVDHAQLTLLVDGFDHLEASQQRRFAAVLETLMRSHPHQTALLCCRRQVMESLGLTFDQFNGGINIMPLAAQQVKDYVLSQNRPDLWPVIKGSKVLQQLARLPLHLTLLVAMANPAEPPLRSRVDLVQRYLDERLAQTSGNSAHHRARLTWLAEQLGHRPRLFYLDDLQRLWLPPGRQGIYRLLLGLGVVLALGPLGGSLPLGLALGLMASQIDLESFPYLRLGLAVARPGRAITLALTCGLLALGLGLGLGTVAALVLSPWGWGVSAFGRAGLVGVLGGWGLGLWALLGRGGSGATQARLVPNQDNALALRNSILLVAVLAVVMGMVLVLPAVMSGQPPLALLPLEAARLGTAGLISAVLWLSFGFQHSLVRLLLGGRQGIPLAARSWLEAMVAVGLLRRLGGGFGFGHEELRQAIAPDKPRGDH